MSAIILLFEIITIFVAALTVSMEFLRDLQMFQQNSYRADRYRRWLRTSQDTTQPNRLLLLILFFVMLYLRQDWWITVFPLLAVLGWRLYTLKTAKYKKPLVMTRRAWRIMIVMTVIELAIAALSLLCENLLMGFTLTLTAALLLSHWIILAAGWLLKPVESHINRGYYNDAARILRSMPGLKIIGITGSYGKTSTKHYLHRILSEHFDTAMTPGSYNTTMGVIRTVREYLKPYNEVFIVEMGAKQRGDIKEICDLVHPTMGIITAVGEQHLESFKTIEGVQATKFELADAIPADGLVVVNDDFEYVANRPVENTACVRYSATNPDVEVHARDITYTPQGTTFTVCGCGPDLTLTTHLVGECNVSNLIAAVVIARRLGVPDDKIRYGVDKIEQVEHRLNLKRTPGGITIIDDAFNSNPHGSRMALDVLRAMTGGRRIVITPGMIELGDKQYELNAALGRHIAECADVAIVVGRYNRDAILEGIHAVRPDGHDVHTTDTFAEAQQLMLGMARAGDTVLYENDLPDTFK